MRMLIVLFFFSFFFTSAFSQQQPVTVLKVPLKYIYNSNGEIVSNATERDDIRNWIVYSDRNNNPTYTSSSANKEFKTISFLQPFWVAEDEGNYLHLYKLDVNAFQLDEVRSKKGKQTRLVNGITDYGWASKDKLLLWSRAISGNNSLNKKLISFNTQPPSYYHHPNLERSDFAKYISPAVLYVYKLDSTNNSVLVGLNFKTSDRQIQSDILGWVKADAFQQWNDRVCLEANWNSESVAARKTLGIKASIFATKEDAINFQKSRPLSSQPISVCDTYEQRLNPMQKRIIILRDLGSDIYEVAFQPIDNSGNNVAFKHGFVSLSNVKLDKENLLFKKVLYLTLEELAELKNSISQLNVTGTGTELRKNLKDAFKQILANYLGDKGAMNAMKSNCSLAYVLNLVTGLPTNNVFLKTHFIIDFDNAQKISDRDLIALQMSFTISYEKLSKAINNDNLIESQPWGKYYWISEDLLP